MSALIDRYLAAALDRIPESQRPDVAREVRGAIEEMAAQRRAAGQTGDVAVRGALTELGDPVKLAASYHQERRYLIGPGWYPTYIEVLKRVFGIAVAIVGIIAIVVTLLDDNASIVDAIGNGLSAAFGVGVQVLLWVTAGFLIAERTTGPEGPGHASAWTVDDLASLPRERQIGLGETIWSIVSVLLFGGLVLVVQQRGVGTLVRGLSEEQGRLALVNPELGTGWVIGFGALVALSVAAAIIRYASGVWTWSMLVLTAVESVAWAVYIVFLAVSEPILNPAFADELDKVNASWWEPGGGANWISALAILAIVGWEVIEGWQGYRQYRARRELTATAA